MYSFESARVAQAPLAMCIFVFISAPFLSAFLLLRDIQDFCVVISDGFKFSGYMFGYQFIILDASAERAYFAYLIRIYQEYSGVYVCSVSVSCSYGFCVDILVSG